MTTRQGERQTYEDEQLRRAERLSLHALFSMLPQAGDVFSLVRRERWLAVARALIDLIYPSIEQATDDIAYQEALVRILRTP